MTAKPTGEFYEYTTIAGDRWDLLAYRYYGDQNKQTIILEANRGLFLSDLAVPALVLPQGLKLVIPVIEEEATNTDLLPPWKRENPDYAV